MRIRPIAFLTLLLATPVLAQQQTVTFPSKVSFETGDTWTHEGLKFRLFGVQSCIRGTHYRLRDGEEGDCGMRSIASLAALFSTDTVACQIVGSPKGQVRFVVCAAEIGGATVDLGTALITSGASFAAVLPSGSPVSLAYAVAEMTAKDQHVGLWAGTFEHPVNLLIGR